jgi:hypothetical protein
MFEKNDVGISSIYKHPLKLTVWRGYFEVTGKVNSFWDLINFALFLEKNC